MSKWTDKHRRDARRGLAICLLAGLPATIPVTVWSAAHAEATPTLDDANLVLSRPRPGYDAEGIALGGFRAFPRIEARATYDDNIYATDTGRVSSPILLLSPQLRLLSQWSRHALSFGASSTTERYPARTSENHTDYSIAAAGRADLGRVVTIDLHAHHLRTIEARGTAGDIFTAGEPIRFRSTGADGGVTLGFAAFSLSLHGEIDRRVYSSANIGGTLVSQSYRDRRFAAGEIQLAYNLSPAIRPFVAVRRESERYDQRDAATTFDSTGTLAMGGFKIALTELLTGSAALGYRWRHYRNPSFAATNGLTYDVSLVWNPRTLLSVTVGAHKSIEESPNLAASGIVSNALSLALDYELRRNLLIGVSAAHFNERYRGIDRIDNRTMAIANARFLFNRFVQLEARFTHTTQNGTGRFGRSYRDNTVGLALTLQR